ncbi:MAG: caspase family protein [Lentimicrobiaceae bacterium]|nr:caspase family protein [Lentimicrobiaceae bacterium]
MSNFRKSIIYILCTVFSCAAIAQNNRALVIGIGDYPIESGWRKINGDKDIEIVCAFLKENGFTQNSIVILKNAEATKANIVEQFKLLATNAKTGDRVYIHFSGHGQQITDTDGDEDDGWDEAWIPYNAQKNFKKGIYEGENHLIDDEICLLLQNIRKKIGTTGELIVVADACHSGDSTRDEEEDDEDIIIRGTLDRFNIPGEFPKKNENEQPLQWIVISACLAYQNNYECKVDGKNYGSLSYSLYSLRNEIGNNPLNVVKNMISGTMKNLVAMPQTIQIETQNNLNTTILFGK